MVVMSDTAVLWVQMQPPAQGSGVDVEGTKRAALPTAGCPPESPPSVLWPPSPHPLLEHVPWAPQGRSVQGKSVPLGPMGASPIWEYPKCAGGALTGEAA